MAVTVNMYLYSGSIEARTRTDKETHFSERIKTEKKWQNDRIDKVDEEVQ